MENELETRKQVEQQYELEQQKELYQPYNQDIFELPEGEVDKSKYDVEAAKSTRVRLKGIMESSKNMHMDKAVLQDLEARYGRADHEVLLNNRKLGGDSDEMSHVKEALMDYELALQGKDLMATLEFHIEDKTQAMDGAIKMGEQVIKYCKVYLDRGYFWWFYKSRHDAVRRAMKRVQKEVAELKDIFNGYTKVDKAVHDQCKTPLDYLRRGRFDAAKASATFLESRQENMKTAVANPEEGFTEGTVYDVKEMLAKKLGLYSGEAKELILKGQAPAGLGLPDGMDRIIMAIGKDIYKSLTPAQAQAERTTTIHTVDYIRRVIRDCGDPDAQEAWKEYEKTMDFEKLEIEDCLRKAKVRSKEVIDMKTMYVSVTTYSEDMFKEDMDKVKKTYEKILKIKNDRLREMTHDDEGIEALEKEINTLQEELTKLKTLSYYEVLKAYAKNPAITDFGYFVGRKPSLTQQLLGDKAEEFDAFVKKVDQAVTEEQRKEWREQRLNIGAAVVSEALLGGDDYTEIDQIHREIAESFENAQKYGIKTEEDWEEFKKFHVMSETIGEAAGWYRHLMQEAKKDPKSDELFNMVTMEMNRYLGSLISEFYRIFNRFRIPAGMCYKKRYQEEFENAEKELLPKYREAGEIKMKGRFVAGGALDTVPGAENLTKEDLAEYNHYMELSEFYNAMGSQKLNTLAEKEKAKYPHINATTLSDRNMFTWEIKNRGGYFLEKADEIAQRLVAQKLSQK